MRIAFCDDDITSCEKIKILSEKYSDEHRIPVKINVFNVSRDFYYNVIKNRLKYDIYFLDIIMPEYSGIFLAKEIRKYDKDGVIVFATVSPEFRREAFLVEAIQYLEKPLKYSSVERCFDRARKMLGISNKKTITVKIPNGLKTIDVSEIVYVEAFLHVLRIYLNDGTYFDTANSSITLSGLKQMLSFPNFCSTSRSYIVNFDYVDYIEGEDMYIKNYRTLKIPSKQIQNVKQKYRDYFYSGE